eukprot:TRINITY_DN74751_c0_g1_i1.p1 TRINITY_DN74751_c0_g1~~TRINITY_DN74751_c0_g1_i1.p1  ORF type:complete len:483 (+),score=285.23 TRINITY_DN74751_c0_g1_i1:29-1450(+)
MKSSSSTTTRLLALTLLLSLVAVRAVNLQRVALDVAAARQARSNAKATASAEAKSPDGKLVASTLGKLDGVLNKMFRQVREDEKMFDMFKAKVLEDEVAKSADDLSWPAIKDLIHKEVMVGRHKVQKQVEVFKLEILDTVQKGLDALRGDLMGAMDTSGQEHAKSRIIPIYMGNPSNEDQEDEEEEEVLASGTPHPKKPSQSSAAAAPSAAAPAAPSVAGAPPPAAPRTSDKVSDEKPKAQKAPEELNSDVDMDEDEEQELDHKQFEDLDDSTSDPDIPEKDRIVKDGMDSLSSTMQRMERKLMEKLAAQMAGAHKVPSGPKASAAPASSGTPLSLSSHEDNASLREQLKDLKRAVEEMKHHKSASESLDEHEEASSASHDEEAEYSGTSEEYSGEPEPQEGSEEYQQELPEPSASESHDDVSASGEAPIRMVVDSGPVKPEMVSDINTVKAGHITPKPINTPQMITSSSGSQ